MEGISLKSRAIAFAFCVGAATFILALLAGVSAGVDSHEIIRAIIIALVCSIMSWASAERAVSGIAEATDAAIERISQAAHGDLMSPTPATVAAALPQLATAMDGLIVQVRSNLENIHTLAMYDPVTQLANRTNFRREASRLLRELPEDVLGAIFFIDLDRFKAVNDSMGHACGDQLLAKVANRLRTVIDHAPDGGRLDPRGTLIGRLAGDEFTILLPEVSSVAEAERAARGVLFALTEPFDIAGQQVEIGASIGVAMRPQHGRSLTELMRAADIAMYDAKDNGRGQVKLFTPELAERLAENGRMEGDIRTALDGNEFELVFEPQLELATGRIVAAEGLLRWNHPLLGTRLPESFIPRVEESGAIQALCDWGIDTVARTLGGWRAVGIDRRLAVNIAPRQIARSNYFEKVRTAIATHRASAAMIEFEIDEHVLIDCGERVLEELAALRTEGATVAIDAFGTGGATVARLSGMPVDRVKIDRSLTARVAASDQARAIAQALVALAHGLGFQVGAEGVDSSEQRAVLDVIGVDRIQGRAVAPPMSEMPYLDWLRGSDVIRAAR